VRRLLIVLLLCGLAPGLWVRTQRAPPNHDQRITVAALSLASGCCRIGPLRLDAVWHLTSANSDFGGYSGLVRIAPGRLLAVSDRGYFLDFPDPTPVASAVQSDANIGPIFAEQGKSKKNRDVEAATFDPVSRRLWLALEGSNLITRHGADLSRQALSVPAAMHFWPPNKGPEAMVRLRDGRFVALAEAFPDWLNHSHHAGLLFPGDPAEGVVPQGFTFGGPEGYRPTDMAQLPDGRVLVVMRRLLWPLPVRASARIVLADPAQIKPNGLWQSTEIARLASPQPVDNFEAIAIDQARDGKIIVWLMSDDNRAASQRTLLWRMTLDPALLPPLSDKQKARDRLARPAEE
jgi:hypothetical protein